MRTLYMVTRFAPAGQEGDGAVLKGSPFTTLEAARRAIHKALGGDHGSYRDDLGYECWCERSMWARVHSVLARTGIGPGVVRARVAEGMKRCGGYMIAAQIVAEDATDFESMPTRPTEDVLRFIEDTGPDPWDGDANAKT